MEQKYPFTKIDHVEYSHPDSWEYIPNNTKYGPEKWVHKSGLVLAVRSGRITLYPPHDNLMAAEELDGKTTGDDPVEHVRSLIESWQ